MGWILHGSGRLGGALAALALLVQTLVPAGFMVSGQARPPGLVICTGHAPVVINLGDHGQPGKSPASKTVGTCVFAGHAATTAPVAPPILASVAYAIAPALTLTGYDLTPGRGLAAPPPPSQGPPSRLT